MTIKHLNDITPGNIYQVDKNVYDLLNKMIRGQMTSICFARKEGSSMLLKPATRRDKKLLLEMFELTKAPFTEVVEDENGKVKPK